VPTGTDAAAGAATKLLERTEWIFHSRILASWLPEARNREELAVLSGEMCSEKARQRTQSECPDKLSKLWMGTTEVASPDAGKVTAYRRIVQSTLPAAITAVAH
jgi:hypothetical protein